MHIMRSIPIVFLFLCLLFLQSCAASPSSTSMKQQAVPRFEQASCPSPVQSSAFNERAVHTAHIHTFLPQMLYQLQAGDDGPFAQAYAQATSVPLHFSQGTFFSMVCSEDAPFTTEQQISQDAQTLLPTLQPLFQNQLTNLWRDCQQWNIPEVASQEKALVKSAVPTLILSGEHDPLTSWTDVTLMRRGLTKSFAIRFPDTGHGVFDGTSCSSSVIAAFLDHLQQPDTSCTLLHR